MKQDIYSQKSLILKTLKKGSKTVSELGVLCGFHDDTIRNRLKELKTDRKIHIESWDMTGVAQIARYRAGRKRDAIRPGNVKQTVRHVSDEVLVHYIHEHPGLSSTEMAKNLQVNWNGLYKQLTRLADARQIEKRNCTRPRFYPVEKDSHWETYRDCFNKYMRSKTVGHSLRGRR